jgi:phosphate-selective porin
MRKLVYSALALTLVSVPGFASDNEWSSLDQEIANLSSSLSAQNAPGPKLGGFIKTSFRYSTDQDALFGGPPNDQDESGFKIDKVRIEISGDANQDYSYKVSFDLASGVASLRDAYVQWKIADTFRATMGQFTKPVLSESLVSDKNLLFYQRTALGEFFRPRATGLRTGKVSTRTATPMAPKPSRATSTTAHASPRTSWVRAPASASKVRTARLRTRT